MHADQGDYFIDLIIIGQMDMNNWNLRPLHKEILGVFRIFASICEKYNLRYYVFYGTALGAVRHGGFIPWDDDFDVAMPRGDYNRFLEVAFEEVQYPFEFCTGGEGSVPAVFFSRIVKHGKNLVEDLSQETGLEIKYLPFIDIFALDGFPGSQKQVLRNGLKRRLLRACQMYRYPESLSEMLGVVHMLCGRIVGFIVSLFLSKTKSNREMVMLMNQKCAEMAPPNCDKYIEYMFYRMREERELPIDWFEPAKVVNFEDLRVRVPAKVEDFLSRYYGDYMKYPEEDSRIPAHQLRADYKEHI